MGALLAARAGGGLPGWRPILWIIVAMVGARSAAMTMNRIADIEFDGRNPRTANRALPAGTLSVGFAWAFTILASAVLVLAAWRLNPLALKLSPVALAILFLYSYTLDWRMLILCAAVTLWVGGFDVLYACQDVDFDRAEGLHSIPKKFGIPGALQIARVMHLAMVALLVWLATAFHLAWPAWVGIAVVALLLGYEHSLVKPNDLSKMNAAFFAVNGYISLLFLLFWGAAVVVMHP